MNARTIYHWALSITFSVLTLCTYGQEVEMNFEANDKIIVVMKDGDELRGTFQQATDSTFAVQTEHGLLLVDRSAVESVSLDDYEGEFKFPNPHDTRYFFGPSAIPLGAGEGYYQNLVVTGNFVNFGVTDNLSLGGGFEFLSTVSGYPIWFLTPKVGWEITDKFHAGGGVLIMGLASEGTASLAYGAATYGGSESNITIGVGYGFVEAELSDQPAIMFAGMHRFSDYVALLSENYLIPTSSSSFTYLGIHGIRILSEKNAFDIGVVVIPELTGNIPLPYVGYARVF